MKYGTSALALFLGFALFLPSAHAQLLNTAGQGTAVISNIRTSTSAPVDASVSASANAEALGPDTSTSVTAGSDSSAGTKDTEPAFRAVIKRSDVLRSDQKNGQAEGVSLLDVGSNNSLKAYATEIVRSDENVQSIDIRDEQMDVRYKRSAKFLGFVPASMTLRVNVDADGTVSVHYPWYAFLMSTDEKKDALEVQLQADVASVLGGIHAGLTGESAIGVSATTSLTGAAGAATSSATMSSRERAYVLRRIQISLSESSTLNVREG